MIMKCITSITLWSLLCSARGVSGGNCWNPNDESYPCWKNVNRGGSTMTAPSPDSSTAMAQLPIMNLEHIALSLRYTCEMNRRLQEATHLNPSIHDESLDSLETTATTSTTTTTSTGRSLYQARGGNTMVQIHPSQQWQPPIASHSSESETEEALTLFHASAPRSNKHRGAARWGPDLRKFVQHLNKELNMTPQSESLVWSLAIIYMDRASSVETVRYSGCATPFSAPRTIHRLLLTAVLLAHGAVHPSRELPENGIAGISLSQLELMQERMLQALGEQALYVVPQQLQDFFGHWQRRWNSGRKIRLRNSNKKPKVRAVQQTAEPQGQVPIQPPVPPPRQEETYYRSTSQLYAPSNSTMATSADATLSLWA